MKILDSVTRIFLAVLLVAALALPVLAQGETPSIQQAAEEVEAAIQSAMSQAGKSGQPTLQQLGGAQGGATGSEAGGSGGSDGGGSGGGGSGGSGGD